MTTTQATQEVVKTVAVSVQEKAEVEGGVLVRLIINSKEWNTKYPVPVKVNKEGAAMLELGHSYTVMLKRERLKKDKTGQYLTDYYWGWNGLAEPGMEDQPQASTPPTDGLAVPLANHRDATGVSIERQTALKAAVETFAALPESLKLVLYETDFWLDRFIHERAVANMRLLATGQAVKEEGK